MCISSMQLAVQKGDLSALKAGPVPNIEELIGLVPIALHYGHGKILEWMFECGLKQKHLGWKYILKPALSSGRTESLDWVMTMGVTPARLHQYLREHEKQLPVKESVYEWIFKYVQPTQEDINKWILYHIKYDNLCVLKWFYSYNPSWFSASPKVRSGLIMETLCEMKGGRAVLCLEWLLSINYISMSEIMSGHIYTYCSAGIPLLTWLINHEFIGTETNLSFRMIFLSAIDDRNIELIKWMDSQGYIHRDDVIENFWMIMQSEHMGMFTLLVESAGIRYRRGAANNSINLINGFDLLQYMYQKMGMTVENCIHEDLIYKAISNDRLQIVEWLLEIGCPLDLNMVRFERSPSIAIITLLCNNGADKAFFLKHSRVDRESVLEVLKAYKRSKSESESRSKSMTERLWHKICKHFRV